MKRKDFKKYSGSRADLEKDLTKHQESLAKLRFDLMAGKVKNIREIRETRRTIAQIKTLLSREAK